MTEMSKLKKRKLGEQNGKTEENTAENNKNSSALPKLSNIRVWSRTVFILALLAFIFFNSRKAEDTILAKQKELIKSKGQSFECHQDYVKDFDFFPKCITKMCGRLVTDKLITAVEADALLTMSQKGFALGGSDGGASIFDLHSGALSYKTKFINVSISATAKKILNPIDIMTYKLVKNKIQHAIAHAFKIDPESLYLTKPTFFSKLTGDPPVTEHDKYWFPHVDKETYGSFHYTSLLYLSDYGVDFKGGRLTFIDKGRSVNVTVEPRKGRVAMFTSGAENLHFVERVTEGTRYAITVSFTCNKLKRNDDQILGNPL